MKILHIGPKNYPPAYGGIEKVVYDISQGMKNVQYYVLVQWPQMETDSVKVLPHNIFKQIKLILSFAKINKISALHFHKEVMIPHTIITSVLGKKTVFTMHGCAWRVPKWAWYYRIASYMLDLAACTFTSRVAFVGEADHRHFSKVVFWRKLYYVPNGIETNSLICSDDTSKCVFIGRISSEKNVLRLIEMFSTGDKKLTIYGPFDKHDKSYEQKVMAVIEKNPNVSYGGVLAHTEINATLSKYNTFYNISFSEGMPVSVLEAASVGLNLVLSNIPQHRDLKFPDAVYVDPYAPNIMEHFRGKSIKNKMYVENNYSIQQTVDQYRRLYEQLINE